MSDYSYMLRQRARHSTPRDPFEGTKSPLQERNAAALLAWRIRWAQRQVLPDAWNGNWRHFFTLHYERKLKAAHLWMDFRKVSRGKNQKVITLRKST